MNNTKMSNISCVRIIGDRVAADFGDGARWELPLADIMIVGEYSTEDGPGAEDHFVCLIDRDGNRYDVGAEEGAAVFLKELSGSLGSELIPRLLLETQFRSCILYPQTLAGCPLFEDVCKPNGLIEKLRMLVGGISHVLRLGPEASKMLSKSVS